MSRALLTGSDSVLTSLISHIRTPLFGSGYALVMSSVATSGLGIVYWTLAAHLYPAAAVGLGATAISTMTFVSYLAALNLNGALSRFIPTAGARTTRLVVAAYAASGLVSLVIASAFVLGIARLLNRQPIATDLAGATWFILATAAWTVFAMQDAVLTGLRRTIWVPIENVVFASLKIALLVLLAGTISGGAIFASWTIPAALMILPVNLAIFRVFIPSHIASHRRPSEITPRDFLRYLSGDYLGSLLMSGTTSLLPLLVLTLSGPTGSAYYFMAWTIAYSLQLVSVGMATSLLVEGAQRRESMPHSSLGILRVLLRIQLPAIGLLVLGASIVLGVFGEAYAAQATPLLRLLALAIFPHALNVLYLTHLRVHRQVRRIVAVQATIAVTTLVLSYLLIPLVGISGAGVAWLMAQALVAIVAVTQLGPEWRSAARPAGPLSPRTAASPEAKREIGRSVRQTMDRSGATWWALRGGDVELGGDVDLLVSPESLSRLRASLLANGYLSLPAYGRGSHRFYLGQTRRGEWLELDVVSELAFGRFFAYRLDVALPALARPRRGGLAALAPDDAFWALLLHCLLDKRTVDESRAATLAAMVDSADGQGAVATAINRLLPKGWTTPRMIDAVRAGQWEALHAASRGMVWRWWRRHPLSVAARIATGSVLRLVEPALQATGRRGLSVTLLGPDGAGKSTLAKGISSRFPLGGRVVYMGLWSGFAATRAGTLLRPLLIWYRWLMAVAHQGLGRLVIYDRHPFDAMLPPQGSLLALKRVYYWLLAHTIPRPDLVFLLDAPAELLHQRKPEGDIAQRERDRLAFLDVARRIGNVRIVSTANRSQTDVEDELMGNIWREYLQRQRGGSAERLALVRHPSELGAALMRRVRRWSTARDPVAMRIAREALASLDVAAGGRYELAGPLRSSTTGQLVMLLRASGADPDFMLKVARTPVAADALDREASRLAALHADGRLDAWTPLVPRPIAHRRTPDGAYLIQTVLSGEPGDRVVRRPQARERLLIAAADTIRRFHVATGTARPVEDAALDEWVSDPIHELQSMLHRSERHVAILQRLEGEVRAAMRGRTIETATVHGDYWPGNLLAAPDGSAITAILDWDLATDAAPALCDYLHLVLYTRRLVEGHEVGQVVASALLDGGWDPAESKIVDLACGDRSSQLRHRTGIVLTWLRHVSSVAQLPGHGDNPTWVRRNVGSVLDALDRLGCAGEMLGDGQVRPGARVTVSRGESETA